MGMTVGELLARASSKELTQWMIFYQLEPFGTQANFLGHAITASTVANANRGKNQQAYEAEDFMPKFKVDKEQSTEEMIAFASYMTAALGGKDERDG